MDTNKHKFDRRNSCLFASVSGSSFGLWPVTESLFGSRGAGSRLAAT
jgi:hypothetical protein